MSTVAQTSSLPVNDDVASSTHVLLRLQLRHHYSSVKFSSKTCNADLVRQATQHMELHLLSVQTHTNAMISDRARAPLVTQGLPLNPPDGVDFSFLSVTKLLCNYCRWTLRGVSRRCCRESSPIIGAKSSRYLCVCICFVQLIVVEWFAG